MNTALVRLRILCSHMRRKRKPSLRHLARMSWTFELTLVVLLPRDNIFYVSIITNSPSNARNFETKMNENRTNRMLEKMLAQPNRLLVELVLVLKEKKSKSPSKKELFCTVLKTICFLVHFKMEVLNTNVISFFSPLTTFTVWKRFYFPFWSNLK